LLFPFILPCSFLVAFAAFAFFDQLQAESIPGIEKLDKPDFLFSRIYNAWLYVNDTKGWVEFTTVMSVIAAGSAGSLLGLVLLLMANARPRGIYESWLAGMFLTCSIAFIVGTADYWKRKAMKSRLETMTSKS